MTSRREFLAGLTAAPLLAPYAAAAGNVDTVIFRKPHFRARIALVVLCSSQSSCTV